jgi:CheY-like chemotaxis protein
MTSPPGRPGHADDAARLEAVIRLVGEVAHDLNNSLLVIRGYSSVLRPTLEAPKQVADVDAITAAADRATSLTTRLLELGQPQPQAEAQDDWSVGALVHGTETILLVEDDEPVRELVRRVLESAGYNVLLAASPSAAERLMGPEHEVDLLVTDVVMPEMSGYDLAARARQSRPELRSLFISGYAHNPTGQTSVDAELLKKPFTPGELARAVRRALDGPVVTT